MAVAVQAVMVTSDADVVSPKNTAVAVNSNCTSCATMAAAYQYVVTTDGPVHLTSEGQQRIADIRQRIAAVSASGLPFPELEARLDVLVQELWSVVDEEMVRAGQSGSGLRDKGVDTEAA